ncbi:hypothetical protein [Rothia dentocariosa]|uniref:hypothetical protein n=1 Tax=Rothia dentocariosa TaxID=2047 RepID=UPI00241FAC61|nr:hypothetical protein [Rothia dentocariosa]
MFSGVVTLDLLPQWTSSSEFVVRADAPAQLIGQHATDSALSLTAAANGFIPSRRRICEI